MIKEEVMNQLKRKLEGGERELKKLCCAVINIRYKNRIVWLDQKKYTGGVTVKKYIEDPPSGGEVKGICRWRM